MINEFQLARLFPMRLCLIVSSQFHRIMGTIFLYVDLILEECISVYSQINKVRNNEVIKKCFIYFLTQVQKQQMPVYTTLRREYTWQWKQQLNWSFPEGRVNQGSWEKLFEVWTNDIQITSCFISN